MRKPRVGFFLLAPATFRKIGEGTARGSYAQRKDAEARKMVETCLLYTSHQRIQSGHVRWLLFLAEGLQPPGL